MKTEGEKVDAVRRAIEAIEALGEAQASVQKDRVALRAEWKKLEPAQQEAVRARIIENTFSFLQGFGLALHRVLDEDCP